MPTVDTDLNPVPFNPGGDMNPLGVVDNVMTLRGKMLQQQQMSQMLAARQKFGQIVAATQASGGSMEDGLNAALKDPLVAGYGGELYAQYKQGLLANVQIQGEQQRQSVDGLGVVHKAIAAAGDDPRNFDKSVNAGLAALSPTARARDAEAVGHIKTMLTTNPDGTPADPATYAANRARWAISTGALDPGTIGALYGTPKEVDQGGQKAFGNVTSTLPGYPGAPAPGSFTPGSIVPMGVAPRTEVTPGGGSLTIPAVPPGAANPLTGGGGQGATPAPPAGSPNPLSAASSIPTTNLAGSPAQPMPSAGAGTASGKTTPTSTFGGGPTVAPDDILPKPVLGTNGLPVRTADQQGSVGELVKQFNEHQPQYDMTAQSLARLDNAKDNIQTLAKGGGWMTPGAAGAIRANLGNVINTFSAIVDPKAPPPVDINKVAAAQDLIKETNTLGFSLAHQMFGGGREPLGIVNDAISSVPGIENSPLGGMLVADILKAGATWQLDQRAFKQDWLERTHGDLTGADTAFAKLNPPSSYMGKVMETYGLGPKGFTSPEAVKSAVQNHLITSKMAYDQMKAQGMISDKVYNAAAKRDFEPTGSQ